MLYSQRIGIKLVCTNLIWTGSLLIPSVSSSLLRKQIKSFKASVNKNGNFLIMCNSIIACKLQLEKRECIVNTITVYTITHLSNTGL